MRLPKSEEQVMKYLWKLEKAFMKDILNQYEKPVPAATTLATLLKRLIEKGFIGYKVYGNNREYYPIISKKDYFSSHLNILIKNFFNDSASQFASFFTKETNLSHDELVKLKEVIDRQIKNEQDDL